MGYVKKPKVFRLVFEDPEMEGLEVRAKPASLEDYFRISALSDGANVDQFGEVIETFASYLLTWNLEDEDGTPVPATYAGLKVQEFEFVMDIVGAWLEALGGVPAPLEQPSGSGATVLEASLPMEPLSESRAS